MHKAFALLLNFVHSHFKSRFYKQGNIKKNIKNNITEKLNEKINISLKNIDFLLPEILNARQVAKTI